MHDLAEEKKRFRLKDHQLAIKTEKNFISQLRIISEKIRIKQITAISNNLTKKLQLDETKSKIANSIIETAFRLFGLVNLPSDIDERIQKRYHITGLDKGR